MGGNVSRINLWAGLLMAGFGTLVVFVLIPYGVAEPKRINFAALSPSYYPRFVAYALIILGTAVAIRSFLSPDQNAKPSDDIRPDAVLRTTLFLGLLLVFAATVSWLGFIVSSFLAAMASFWLAGEKRLHITLPIAILVPTLLYFFFLKVARVPIPLGILKPYLEGI